MTCLPRQSIVRFVACRAARVTTTHRIHDRTVVSAEVNALADSACVWCAGNKEFAIVCQRMRLRNEHSGLDLRVFWDTFSGCLVKEVPLNNVPMERDDQAT